MNLLSTWPLAEIPWTEGLSVFAYGFSGVFVALGLLAGGVKLVSLVLNRMDAGQAGDADKKA
jgi:hypothetical protein